MKPEFSKIVLGSAVVIWAAGAVFGAYIVNEEREQLRELLTYIDAPTAMAFGFYLWKSKAENILKIAKNKKLDDKTKKQVIDSVTKGLQNSLYDMSGSEEDSNGIG